MLTKDQVFDDSEFNLDKNSDFSSEQIDSCNRDNVPTNEKVKHLSHFQNFCARLCFSINLRGIIL